VTASPLRTVEVRYTPEVFDLHRAVNATERDFPLHRTAPELFRDQACRTPEATAVRDAVEDVTYRQLDERVDRIAAGLRAAGCRPGDIAVLVAERGAWFVAAVLAMLRAGVVYLPLDPRSPTARTRQLLADSRPRLVLADGAAHDTVASLALDVPVRRIRELAETAPAMPPVVHADDPAYVIYTSGSTGAPKGAIVHQRGMVNQLHVKITDLGIGPTDRVAQNAPQTFDISIWQMVAPLLVGATVEVLADEVGGDPAALGAAVVQRGLTVLEIVPSLLSMIAGGPITTAFGALRLLVVTGEELRPQTARRWFARNPTVPLVNAYGPTECSDDVSHCHITAPPPDQSVRVPIGRAVANVQLWVVRPDGSPGVHRLCAPGEEGELWVTGVGVGLGYLHAPEQTARSFFADPFRPGGRLYRTGDLVVMDTGGVLTYHGRLDRQVKVRGHRIELGEIDAVLGQHEQVRAVAVDLRTRPTGRRAVAREWTADHDEPGRDGGQKLLVAYVVTPAPMDALSDWLAERLPRHMIPDRITSVERIPQTRNGKVDYRALPDPGTGRPALASPYAPAADATERAVVATWSAALGVEPIGRDDDFFELAGDSLLAMVIVGRLNDRFGTALRVRDLLETRTPGELAALIGRRRDGRTARDTPRSPAGTTAAVSRSGARHPLSVHQHGVWFQWTAAPGNPYYNYQGTWTMRGPVDRTALTDAWARLVSAHPLLRGRFVEEDGAPVLEYPWHDVPELTHADLSDEARPGANERLRAEALRDAQRSYDLARDVLVRARVYRLTPEHHELVLSTHEILLDGWGAAVLTRELAEHYTRVLAGLPAEPTSPGHDDFTRFLDWEARTVTREGLARQGAHWRAVLDGELPVLRLPLDRPRPRVPTHRGDSRAARLSGDLLTGLRALGARHGVTLFSTLLAGYGVVLGRYAGQDDVVVGVPVANRNRAELQDTVGFLINMLPIRLRLDWEQPFSAHLRAVGDLVSAALAHCEYPFPWMVQDAGVSRSAATSPVFQTMFNMLNFPEPPPRAGSLHIEFNELETGFTKYELSLYAQPGTRDDLHLQLAFQTDVFEATTVQRIFDGLLTLYQDVVRDEHVALGDARVVDEAQLRQILRPGP